MASNGNGNNPYIIFAASLSENNSRDKLSRVKNNKHLILTRTYNHTTYYIVSQQCIPLSRKSR